jgi:hypothetical protein
MFFEKIIDMLHFINQQLPQWSIYESLFPTHKRVSLAVSNAFLDVLRFCAQAKAVLRKGSSVCQVKDAQSYKQRLIIEPRLSIDFYGV